MLKCKETDQIYEIRLHDKSLHDKGLEWVTKYLKPSSSC